MKITPALRKEINAAVRANVSGANPLAEVGLRGADNWRPNALAWTEDDDLGDLVRLANLKTIDDVAAFPGYAELDLYVTTGIGSGRELETNVAILIRDGHVVGSTSHSLAVRALKTSISFPEGMGW